MPATCLPSMPAVPHTLVPYCHRRALLGRCGTALVITLPGDLLVSEVEIHTRSPSYEEIDAVSMTALAASPSPPPVGPLSAANLDTHLTCPGNIWPSLNLSNPYMFSQVTTSYDLDSYDDFGLTGTSIDDGGRDMYDDGNFIHIESGGTRSEPLQYTQSCFGGLSSAGVGDVQYATCKHANGLFVAVFTSASANITGVEINGGLGCDGDGNVWGNTVPLSSAMDGANYYGWYKNIVCDNDPSINHLIISADSVGSHSWSTYTGDDEDIVTFSSGVQTVYYLLWGGYKWVSEEAFALRAIGTDSYDSIGEYYSEDVFQRVLDRVTSDCVVSPPPPSPPPATCDESMWPDLQLVCSPCKALVIWWSYGHSCDGYCSSIGRQCVAAWEDGSGANSCTNPSMYSIDCDTSIGSTSDGICECGHPQPPARPPPPLPPPSPSPPLPPSLPPPSPPLCVGEMASTTDFGIYYRGCRSVTRSGRTCQAWSSQKPHAHDNTAYENPQHGLLSNYCRNPDGSDTIWCYTTDPETRWEYCDALPLPFPPSSPPTPPPPTQPPEPPLSPAPHPPSPPPSPPPPMPPPPCVSLVVLHDGVSLGSVLAASTAGVPLNITMAPGMHHLLEPIILDASAPPSEIWITGGPGALLWPPEDGSPLITVRDGAPPPRPRSTSGQHPPCRGRESRDRRLHIRWLTSSARRPATSAVSAFIATKFSSVATTGVTTTFVYAVITAIASSITSSIAAITSIATTVINATLYPSGPDPATIVIVTVTATANATVTAFPAITSYATSLVALDTPSSRSRPGCPWRRGRCVSDDLLKHWPGRHPGEARFCT